MGLGALPDRARLKTPREGGRSGPPESGDASEDDAVVLADNAKLLIFDEPEEERGEARDMGGGGET